MNVFEHALRQNKISSEDDLKRLFWLMAKKIHPDVSSIEKNHELFIKLKSDFDSALRDLRFQHQTKKSEHQKLNRQECIDIFIDLVACNFPMDESVKNKNKLYQERINLLNNGLSSIKEEYTDLFVQFESEMYSLKGKTTVSNHLYSLVKLYLYRFSDYVYYPNINNRNYLTIGYKQIQKIFADKNMKGAARFIDWLVEDIVGLKER